MKEVATVNAFHVTIVRVIGYCFAGCLGKTRKLADRTQFLVEITRSGHQEGKRLFQAWLRLERRRFWIWVKRRLNALPGQLFGLAAQKTDQNHRQIAVVDVPAKMR